MLKVWIAAVKPLGDPTLYERWFERMPAYRKDKITRIAAPEGRQRSLAAGALEQTVFRSLGLPEEPLRIGRWGKPYFAGREDLYFNLSHSGDRVMLALSDHEVGCDVEKMREGKVSERVARRFFSKEERAMIGSARDEEQKLERFFRFWTLKESFLKTTGHGLTVRMDSFCVHLPDTIGGEISLEQDVDPREFQLMEWSLRDGYCYSLCVAESEDRSGEDIEPEWVDLGRALSELR